jgi:hypothetical protein
MLKIKKLISIYIIYLKFIMKINMITLISIIIILIEICYKNKNNYLILNKFLPLIAPNELFDLIIFFSISILSPIIFFSN